MLNIGTGQYETCNKNQCDFREKKIWNLHFTYDDPDTGLKVITRLRHHLKGSCCGNACRHCVYNHEGVPEERVKERVFNSAFWKNIGE